MRSVEATRLPKCDGCFRLRGAADGAGAGEQRNKFGGVADDRVTAPKTPRPAARFTIPAGGGGAGAGCGTIGELAQDGFHQAIVAVVGGGGQREHSAEEVVEMDVFDRIDDHARFKRRSVGNENSAH